MHRSREGQEQLESTNLTPTFERLVERIGDRIGRKLVRALTEVSPPRGQGRSRRVKKVCGTEGCERFAVAKGLCKSHYNLMLYHRRKAATSEGTRRASTARGKRSGRDA